MNQSGCSNLRGALVLAFSSLFFALGSAGAATPCFKVYDGRGSLKYEGPLAPVDLRDADSESWTQLKRRGDHLYWHTSDRCQGDQQQAAPSTVGRQADRKGNAELILNRIPAFAGKQAQ